MDNRTIFSKTGRGSLEITKKSIKLAAEERQALILVDGKSTLAELEAKLSKVSPIRLRAIFDNLLALDLIRVFVTKGGPDSISPMPGGVVAGIGVQEITEDDLDFTAFAPVTPAKSADQVIDEKRRAAEEAEKRAAAERIAKEQAERQAREAAELKAREEAARIAREEAERKAREEAERKAREAAELKAREEAARIAREAAERKAREEAERQAREAAELKAREEAARIAREAAERKAREEAERQAREAAELKAREEAARIAREAAERKAREEAERQAREAAELKAREESVRIAREAAERKAREEAERKAREEAERQAREAAELKAREEAARIAREAAERKAREEAERKAREAAELKAREEAARIAREEAERKAREEAERQAREAAEMKAREEAARIAREAAERKAREEAERKAREAAELKVREEAARIAREEAERKAREEAERKAREAAELKAREEAARIAREEAERQARAQAEALERARAEEEEARRRALAEQAARDEAARVAREHAAARERARIEEESIRRKLAEKQAQEEAQRLAAQEAAQRAEAEKLALQKAEEQRRAEEEANRYTAALTPHLEAATETPALLPMGAFSNLAALESNGPDSQQAAAPEAAPVALETNTDAGEKKSRKDLEREAKERAKEEAKARKQAEKEAKRLAKESSSDSGSALGAGKIVAAIMLLLVGGVVAYIFTLSADKPAIEKLLSARFGVPVTVGDAKFSAFPAELRLSNVMLGDIKLPQVVASGELSSLASGDKVWRNVDVTGLELDVAQVERMVGWATSEQSARNQAFTLQRIRALAVGVNGTPIKLPKFDATILVASNGSLKQATLALPDGKAQVLLSPEEKGWLVDIESRGVAWPIGPKVAWESLRSKGIATRDGMKFDEFILTYAGGSARGTGDLAWAGNWKFTGTVEVSGIDTEGIGAALYGTSPVSGPIEGKFSVAMSAPALARLFEAPQLEGNFVVSRAVFKTMDFARVLQGADAGSGQTRLPEVTGSLASSAGRLQLRQLRGTSGLLSISGNVDVSADAALSGNVNVEVGASGSRGRAALRIGGTIAEPRFTK